MEISLIVLSFALLISLFFIGKLYSDNTNLRKEITGMISKVDEKVSQLEELVSIEPGDKAIIPNYGLCYNGGTKEEQNFKVTYEIEILEVSTDKVKVKAIDFTSTDKVGRDPQNRQGIIDFMNKKWISRKDIELVVDDQMRRDRKINQILN